MCEWAELIGATSVDDVDSCCTISMNITVTMFDLDEDVTTILSDKFWKCRESFTSVLTDVDLQS